MIFDCDGVLVDSEPLAAAVFSRELARLGLILSAEDCYHLFHGQSLDYCFSWLECHFETTLPEGFGRELMLATEQAFSKDLKAVAGIDLVLEQLEDRHISYCVASNSGHGKIANSMKFTGLDRFFSRAKGNCFSVDDVSVGKPAPELFLFAAESMGVPAAFATVVEDSLAGITAAQRAGMRLLVHDPLAGFADRQDLVRFSSMSQLPVQLFGGE